MFNSTVAGVVGNTEEIAEDGETHFNGMEITFLGTSSGSPSFTRNVSSYALRLHDEIWLFDCGEAGPDALFAHSVLGTPLCLVWIGQ